MKSQVIKILLLTELFIIGKVCNTSAQFSTYHHFPDSNAYWIETTEHVSCGIYNTEFDYFLKGDTVLQGKTYHKIYENYGISWAIIPMLCGGGSYYYLFNNVSFVNAIRDDTVNKKVYLYCRSCLSHDTLLYDFNLNVGDTLPAYNQWYSDYNIISAIDSIKIDSTYNKQFIIGNPAYDSIVEGIGSMSGLLEYIGTNSYSSPGLTTINCFWQNGVDLLNPSPIPDCEPYNGTSIIFGIQTINNNTANFIAFPNPCKGIVSIQIQTTNAQDGWLELYTTLGQPIKRIIVQKNVDTYYDDVSNLPNGIYYYTLNCGGINLASKKLVVIK